MLGICQGDLPQSVQEAGQLYLPVNRWGGLGSMHTKLSWNPVGGDWGSKIQRNGVIEGALSAGDAAWMGSAGVVENATQFCVGSSIVRSVDHSFGIFGNAMFESGVIAGIIALGAGVLIWRARKVGAQADQWIRMVVTLGVLATLVFGAMNTSNSPPKIGTGSPAWWSIRANYAISELASTPASTINDLAVEQTEAALGSTGNTSCLVYRQNLRDEYKAVLTAAGGESQAVVQSSIDAMWQTTGMRAFTQAQFGARNPWGDEAACHLYDYYKGVPVADQIALSGIPAGATDPDAVVWTPDDNDQVDRAMIAWAGCEYTGGAWKARSEWAAVAAESDKDSDPDKSCQSAFRDAGEDGGEGILDWPADDKDIRAKTVGHPEVQDFLLNLHGNVNGTASAIAVLYAGASGVSFLVNLVLAGAVFIAKLFLLVIALFVIAMLIRGLWPGGENAIAKASKQYLGMATFVFGATFILSLVAIINAALVVAGVQGLDVSAWSMIWTGLAPVAAIFIVHQLFTKVFKAPSPFKPSSAMQWGAAAAGGGMIAGAGIGLDRMFGRGQSRARAYGRSGVRRATDAALFRRRMDRIGSLRGAAATGAAGAAGAAAHSETARVDRSEDSIPHRLSVLRGSLDAYPRALRPRGHSPRKPLLEPPRL